MPQTVNKMCTCKCAFGTAPVPLKLTMNTNVVIGKTPAGTVFDMAPMSNIGPFGMCLTLSNPQTAAQTAAALGVLTPAPCIPVIAGPWTSVAPKVKLKGKDVLCAGSQATCAYGGVISIMSPGQTTVNA